MTIMINKVLDDRYQLVRKIGTGGMADVYLAKDLLLDRKVAVKILHSNFAEDNEFIARFRREAQSAGKLSHPNIVGIYDVGCSEGYHYIVMEYVEGQTLKQYINTHPHIPIDTAVRIAIDIGNALAEAHSHGIIHCDIKPQNILLTANHKVKVTDFGIARAVNSSTIMTRESILGSVHYLSPEQAAGDKLTAKTDIYSLGIVLYEMLTHHLPFDGDTAVSIALKHMQDDVPRPTRYNPAISPMLEECLLTALQRDPNRRYDTVQDFVSELKIAQGFTASPFKPAEREFATMTRPISQKTRRIERCDSEGKVSSFISNLPQKYIWGGLLVIFAAAFAWAFFSFGNFWSNKVVGEVIAQTPTAGTEVKEQRIIHLTVSKGGTVILAPDLKGLTLDQARERLSKLNLVLGTVRNGSNPNMPADVIISQTPASASQVDSGTQINVVINVRQSKVPNVVGMTLADAKNALRASDLSVGQVTSNDGTSPSDVTSIVVSQSPNAGANATGVVNLVISSNNKPAQPVTKSGTVNITLPGSGDSKKVEIFVTDSNGRREVYSQTAAPGSNIVKDVSGTGTVRVQVVVDGSVIQDREL